MDGALERVQIFSSVDGLIIEGFFFGSIRLYTLTYPFIYPDDLEICDSKLSYLKVKRTATVLLRGNRF